LPLRLKQMGFDIRINLFSWQKPEEGIAYRKLREHGIPVRATNFCDTATNIRWLLDGVTSNRPDVFIANHVIPAYYAARYLKESGIATIGILRSDDPFYHAIAERFVYPAGPYQVTAVVCVSEYLRQLVLQRSTSSLLSCRIPSGTPVPSLCTTSPTGSLKVAYVGRIIEEQKQASLLTRALIKATSEVEGVEAFLYGDGSARTSVENIIDESGTARVQFVGNLPSDELQRRLLTTHVVIMLSDYEGTPTAVMEAMACGCVPVCLKIRSGIPELVEDGVTGLLVEDRDEAFVAAIRRLREEPELWSKLSANARTRIREQFSVSICASKWSDLLTSARMETSSKETFVCPKKIRLPSSQPGFAHQDRRAPNGMKKMRSVMVGKYRRTRMFIGRIRRQLLGQPFP